MEDQVRVGRARCPWRMCGWWWRLCAHQGAGGARLETESLCARACAATAYDNTNREVDFRKDPESALNLNCRTVFPGFTTPSFFLLY